MQKNIYDVVIAGGGVMGCSAAYHLMAADRLNVAVIEKDPTYAKAFTPLCIGNVHTQFNLKETVMSAPPELKGFYLANGFSGHGFQQAAAVGRHLCELITRTETSMDLSVFGTERIMENKPIVKNVIV